VAPPDIGDGLAGQFLKLGQAESIVWIYYVNQMMADEGQLFAAGFGGADVHMAVYLAAIGADYLCVESLG
jgi:hypothetical protein